MAMADGAGMNTMAWASTEDRPNVQMARYWTEIGGPHWVNEQRQFDQMLTEFDAESRRVLDAKPGEHVLDVGCGTGTTTLAIADAVGTTGSVVGCDISATMIDAARARAKDHRQVSLAIADAQTDDLLQADLFDAVYSRFGVIQFVCVFASRTAFSMYCLKRSASIGHAPMRF